jgi:hypothetical protein
MNHRPDDRGSTYLWNVSLLQGNYKALHPRRHLHTSRRENLKYRTDCKMVMNSEAVRIWKQTAVNYYYAVSLLFRHLPLYTKESNWKPHLGQLIIWLCFFSWRWGGSNTQAWMPTCVSILRIPQMIWVWRATVEWYIDRGKPKNSEKSLSQCHYVHHKSHIDWPGSEAGLRGERPATNDLSHGTVMVMVMVITWSSWIQAYDVTVKPTFSVDGKNHSSKVTRPSKAHSCLHTGLQPSLTSITPHFFTDCYLWFRMILKINEFVSLNWLNQ